MEGWNKYGTKIGFYKTLLKTVAACYNNVEVGTWPDLRRVLKVLPIPKYEANSAAAA